MNYSKVFWIIMLIFFVIFISIFMASRTGYYEYENSNKAKLTEEKMKKFEEDISNGKEVDIKNYLTEDKKDYDNKVTNIGNKMSSLVTTGVSKGLEESFKLIEKLLQ